MSENTLSRKPRAARIAGITAGVLAAALLFPATSWTVRSQFRMALFNRGPSAMGPILGIRGGSEDAARGLRRRIREFAAAHPNDYQVQLAAAIDVWEPGANRDAGGSDHPIRTAASGAVRDLATRMPPSASLYANLLRFAAQGEITGCKRDEESLLTDNEPDSLGNRRPSQEALDSFDHFAAEGERLEPDNAYFPLMRAVGQFAARRDDAALASLDRAARAPRWEEHYEDEYEGRLRILSEAFGERGASTQSAVAFGLLFPQYAGMRSVARVATWKALQLEKQGRIDAGVAIRRNLIVVGGRMRTQARSLIGTLVGIAIQSIAISRPGGGPYVKPKPGTWAHEHRDATTRRLTGIYCDFLKAHNHPNEAEWVRGQAETALALRRGLLPYPDQIDPVRQLSTLGAYWTSGVATLSSAAWILLLGAAAALLMRLRHARVGRPMPPYARYGAVLGVALTALIWTLVLLRYESGVGLMFATGAGIAVLAAFAVVSRSPDARRALTAFVIASAVTSGVVWVCQARFESSGALLYSWLLLTNESVFKPGPFPSMLGAIAWLAWVTPLVPITFGLVIALVSVACRVPVSIGWIRGFRGLAVPSACLLAAGYMALLVPTVRQDALITETLNQTIQHEGRFVARITGMTWPEEVPPPAR